MPPSVPLAQVVAAVLRQVLKLSQGAGSDVRGRPAAPVEVHHALRLIQGREPLGAPLTGVVGGLEADFDSHRVGCV